MVYNNVVFLLSFTGVAAKILNLSVSPLRYNLGDDVEVTCSAMGVPKPTVEWSVLVRFNGPYFHRYKIGWLLYDTE